jgi:hypothetical protein
LDDYGAVKPLAKLIARATSERSMPPWAVTSDDTCGTFSDSKALSDDEIEQISEWVSTGAAEGDAQSKATDVQAAESPKLSNTTELRTPQFTPVAQGGALTESDEYRCFAVELPDDTAGYVTGYEVVPGTAEIVHHVAAFVIDPAARASEEDGQVSSLTNRERMQQLDAESPDRDGWPCFNAAGDGVETEASFVVWAPGQGVVSFPKGTGVPLEAKHQVVIQVHYNLSDTKQRGKSDQTRVRLRIEKDVDEVGIFVLEDPLLNTLYDDNPTTLPPKQASTIYSWTRSAKQMGLGEGASAKLYGVMPHMHALGRKYELTIAQNDQAAECAAKIERWDFHWQRMYFYQEPYVITPSTTFSVSCDYDTSSVSQPVRPGWGTGNEMCLATLFLGVDKETYKTLRH